MASTIAAKSCKAVRPAVRTSKASGRAARVQVTVQAALAKAGAAAPAVVATVGAAAESFHIWNPINNKMFETFSFLPPLTDRQIAAQVDYIVRNGWTPCLEFSAPEAAYVSNDSAIRFGPVSAGYQDNRYWTMWKLPMFGCTDASQVLREVDACNRAFSNAYVRLVAFDANRQVQITGFLVHRPSSAKEYQPVEKRSIRA
jgi:ribulose-bisphosphate carboxylase small chain